MGLAWWGGMCLTAFVGGVRVEGLRQSESEYYHRSFVPHLVFVEHHLFAFVLYLMPLDSFFSFR